MPSSPGRFPACASLSRFQRTLKKMRQWEVLALVAERPREFRFLAGQGVGRDWSGGGQRTWTLGETLPRNYQ